MKSVKNTVALFISLNHQEHQIMSYLQNVRLILPIASILDRLDLDLDLHVIRQGRCVFIDTEIGAFDHGRRIGAANVFQTDHVQAAIKMIHDKMYGFSHAM